MTRILLSLAAVVSLSAYAAAHFVYIVPAADQKSAVVVFSDDLNPDDAVEIEKVAGLKLQVRTLDGKDAPAGSKTDKHSLKLELPASGARIVYGSVDYGVMQRGDAKPFLLVYHPKTLVGEVPADKASLGAAVPAEVIPVREGDKVRFKVLAAQKPVADAEVNVLGPDGAKAKLKTNAEGLTDGVAGKGRFAAWARVAAIKAGEFGGKKYEEVRHYPTIVVDVK